MPPDSLSSSIAYTGLSKELERTLEDIERAAAGNTDTRTAEPDTKQKEKEEPKVPQAKKQAPAGEEWGEVHWAVTVLYGSYYMKSAKCRLSAPGKACSACSTAVRGPQLMATLHKCT